MAFALVSSAFSDQGEIPRRHTCDGEDISPPLVWLAPSARCRSMVLAIEDPDAPDPEAPITTWVHWLLYNLPPTAGGMPEGVQHDDLPPGTKPGWNDWQRTGYSGPCPTIGRHRYIHRLSALDVLLPDLGTPTKAELEKAMTGHVIERAELVGTYERQAG